MEVGLGRWLNAQPFMHIKEFSLSLLLCDEKVAGEVEQRAKLLVGVDKHLTKYFHINGLFLDLVICGSGADIFLIVIFNCS